ncbi:M48 family metallopeptidase [Luteolibacter sp.]|uniref:M48 family metallopeptidase n=2 Tax=Luteolibacter sp. TaxID=1962973 RepID=UPI0032651424
MSDWNFMSVIILIGVFVLWKLELAATLLNLKAFPSSVPKALDDLMDSEKLEKARSYLRVNAKFGIIQSTVSLVALLVFWSLGGFAWLDEFSRSLTKSPVAAGLIFLSLLILGQSLIGLPFSIYDTFVIEQKFGFNRSTPATFIMDRVKGLVLAAVIGLPLGAAVLWIFGNVHNAWLWAWLVVTAFQLILTYLAPSLIMPLFNKFTPMPDGELKQQIEALGVKCGFPLTGVFVMDGSKRSTKANAFFTGLGKQKKIALFDTLVEKSSQPELLGVLAHEIGHFRCGHIKQRLAVGILQTAVIFFLLGLATDPDGKFARQLFDAFGVKQISPQVGLVLFSILLEPVSKLLGVLANAWSRRHEFEADAYAAKVTGDGAALGDALKKMSADHLSHPSPAPLRVWLDYSHPPLVQRLDALGKCSGL